MTIRPAKTGLSRVFYIENKSGPGNAPVYLGYGRAMGQSWPQGDQTPIRTPSDRFYDEYETVGKVKGQRGLPTQSIQTRMQVTQSEMLELVRRGCEIDLHTHFGECLDPTDFDGGWRDGHVRILTNARPTNYSTGDLGALDADQSAAIDEDIAWTGDDIIQIYPITAEEQANAGVTDPIISVAVCDRRTCGACGIPSDGCQVAFALGGVTTGSPGLPAELQYTSTGGATWASTAIPPMPLAEVPTHMACVGTNLVIISNAGGALYYAPVADIVAGTATWTRVTTGFVGAGAPNRIHSRSRTRTWVVGNGGYVYNSTDITGGVSTQTAGSITSQNLNDIDSIDDLNLVAVGASNTVLVTTNGGDSWQSKTGPSVGVALNTVAMLDRYSWIIGTAGGKLFYTRDGGVTWTEKAFSGSGAGSVRDIAMVNRQVGYMAHDTAAPAGRLFRTINGGNSWYTVPEGTGQTFPSNQRITAVAACIDNPNVVYAGGMGAGSDGILLKAS